MWCELWELVPGGFAVIKCGSGETLDDACRAALGITPDDDCPPTLRNCGREVKP